MSKLREIVGAMTPGPWEARPHPGVPSSVAQPDMVAAADGEVCSTRGRLNLNGVADARGIVALRNLAPELLAVVEAVRLDHEQSIGPEEEREGVKQWWKLPATKTALDALDRKAVLLRLREESDDGE